MAPSLLLLAAVAVAVAQASPFVPNGRWYQSMEKVFLEISITCTSDRIVSITNDTFSLECKAAGNKDAAFEFAFREDIDAAASVCVATETLEACTLVKTIPHYFDRLTQGAEELSKQLGIDWGRWREVDDHSESGVDQYEDHVEQYDAAAYATATATSDVVVMDPVYPWCNKCAHIKKPFIALAKAMKKKAIFGWVDAREEPALRKLMQPQCGHVCRVAVAKAGENISLVEVKHELPVNQRMFGAFIGPLLTPLATKADLKAIRKDNPAVVVAVGLDAPQLAAFAESARALRGVIRAATAADPAILGSPKLSGPSFVVFRSKEKTPDVVPYAATNLTTLLRASSYPLLPLYTYDMNHDLDVLGLPLARVWADDTPETRAFYEPLSLRFRGRLMFIRMLPKDSMHFLIEYGLPKQLPAFGISAASMWDSPKYAYEGEHTLEGLTDFCERYLRGEVPRALKSEQLPPALAVGTIGKVVGRTMAAVEDGAQDVLLAFYKTWTSEWKQRNESLANVARCVKGADVLMATFDISNNEFNKTRYPTADAPGGDLDVYLFHTLADGTRTPVKYEGTSYSRKDLLRFLKAHSPAVQAHWSAVVAESEAITAEAKALEEEAKAKRAAAEAALEKLPKVELADDAGVVKQTLAEGAGDIPAAGAVVKAHYTGTLLDGTEFDSSRKRSEPFTFTLGKGQVIGCWDRAFAAMRKGEHAVITCKPAFAYGAQGSPPKIPADATLRFDVELIDFTGPAASDAPPKTEL